MLEKIAAIRAKTVVGLIMAGGQGRRLGHRDKAWLMADGQPFIEHALHAMQCNTRQIIISANRHHWHLRRYSQPVIHDIQYPSQGPLSAIFNGFESMRRWYPHSEWLLTLPVDALRPPANFGQKLRHPAQNRLCRVLRSRQGECPLIALLHTSLQPQLADYLNTGRRSFSGWLKTLEQSNYAAHQPVYVNYNSHPDVCCSVNTPNELRRARLRVETV